MCLRGTARQGNITLLDGFENEFRPRAEEHALMHMRLIPKRIGGDETERDQKAVVPQAMPGLLAIRLPVAKTATANLPPLGARHLLLGRLTGFLMGTSLDIAFDLEFDNVRLVRKMFDHGTVQGNAHVYNGAVPRSILILISPSCSPTRPLTVARPRPVPS